MHTGSDGILTTPVSAVPDGSSVTDRVTREGMAGSSGSNCDRRAEMKTKLIIGMVLTVAVVLTGLTGCMASQHRRAVQDDSGDRVTVGTVQQSIHVGMSGAEVAEVLGSPNIVSTDEERREVWIYDKITSESVYSSSEGGILSLIFVDLTDVLTGGAGGLSGSSGAESSSQRTLTVIIKFDEDKRVRDFAYHTSRF